MGSEVVMVANSLPAINDVTCAELRTLLESVCEICPVLKVGHWPYCLFDAVLVRMLSSRRWVWGKSLLALVAGAMALPVGADELSLMGKHNGVSQLSLLAGHALHLQPVEAYWDLHGS